MNIRADINTRRRLNLLIIKRNPLISEIFNADISDLDTLRQTQLSQTATILGNIEHTQISDEFTIPQIQIPNKNTTFANGLNTLIIDTGAVAQINELQIDVVVDETSFSRGWRD
jgi:hypothetical protein